MMRRFALVLIGLLLVACDDTPVYVAPPSSRPAALELVLKPITPLLPNRPTHVAVDPLGNVYWSQETDRRDDTLFVIGEGEIPRATQLSVGTIAASLGAAGGRGNIQGLAAGPVGEIYFYFSGALGRQTLVCLGQFSPKTSRIRILADTDALATATGMGRSLTLARGSVLADSRNVWLWVRHTDDGSVFRFDPRSVPTDRPLKLVKPFEKVRLDQQPIDLTRDDQDLAAVGEGTLFLTDLERGVLLRIDSTGAARRERSLVGLSRELSTPLLDRSGRLILFAARGETIPPKSADDAVSTLPEVLYPALLIFEKDQLTQINRDNVRAYPGFPIFAMKLRKVVAHPSSIEEGWIGYDSGSGELLRVQIAQQSP